MLRSLHLIWMSRAPVAGSTKTRLIPALGAEGARDFHVACINDLLAESRVWAATRRKQGAIPTHLHLFVTPPASQPMFRKAGVNWPNDFRLHNQRGETLGARMAHAIESVRARATQPAGVLLAGTDLPLLTGERLEEAAASLEKADVVFGPTDDGGYYLIGVKEEPCGLFDLRNWGGESVLADSLAAARKAGKSTALIAALPDADTEADLRTIRGHPLAAALAERSSLRFLAARLGESAAGSS